MFLLEYFLLEYLPATQARTHTLTHTHLVELDLKRRMCTHTHTHTHTGRPVVDFGSMVQCLNKLDVGVSEKVLLMSPDFIIGG